MRVGDFMLQVKIKQNTTNTPCNENASFRLVTDDNDDYYNCIAYAEYSQTHSPRNTAYYNHFEIVGRLLQCQFRDHIWPRL